jgi:hypothetical protein
MNIHTLGNILAGIGVLFATIHAFAQPDLRYEENESVTWEEAIEIYSHLDNLYAEARLIEAGETDIGKPLHLFIISLDRTFTPAEVHRTGKSVVFINNGIHPGEPCGIDASIKFAGDLLSGSDHYRKFLENTVVVMVPVFNIGGALNRSPYNRTNQNGPVEQGFRGNAKNLDLNRDFMKLDSKNTRSLVSLIREWEPDILVDTHTSNGADYPYVITLIANHPQRLEPPQSNFLTETLLPFLYGAMRETPYEMSPYIWSYRQTPEDGIIGFMDYPRYTSGYGGLFNTLCFTIETHMFKPFRERVLSTYYFLREILRFSSIYKSEISDQKRLAETLRSDKKEFVLEWTIDTTRYDLINFKGYAAKTKPSKVTGFDRLYYDRSESWERDIPYYNYFNPVVRVESPDYYIIPCAWEEVIDRFILNDITMWKLDRDSLIEVEAYFIEDFETRDEPYNGHYWHYNITTRKEVLNMKFHEGDYIVPVHQSGAEYIVQALEPQGYDSFFSWNFFDAILSRKEYFSPYVFEEKAEMILSENPALKAEFERLREQDDEFRSSSYAQLSYIYSHSVYSESTYRRYPVYRYFKKD